MLILFLNFIDNFSTYYIKIDPKLDQVFFPSIISIWGLPLTTYAREGEGRGLAKCICYYISLCTKLAYGGGGRAKNWQNLAYVVYGWPL